MAFNLYRLHRATYFGICDAQTVQEIVDEVKALSFYFAPCQGFRGET